MGLISSFASNFKEGVKGIQEALAFPIKAPLGGMTFRVGEGLQGNNAPIAPPLAEQKQVQTKTVGTPQYKQEAISAPNSLAFAKPTQSQIAKDTVAKNIASEQANPSPIPFYAKTTGEKIGMAASLVGNFNNKTKELSQDLAKSVVRAVPRTITSVGIQPAADLLSAITGTKVNAEFTPTTRFEKMVFGEEPIKGIFEKEQDAQLAIEDYLNKTGLDKNFNKGQAMALAPLFVAGSIGLDLSPLGGEKNTAKLIAKSKDAEEITRLLRPMFNGKTDDELRLIATELRDVTKPEAVKDVIMRESAIKPSVAENIAPVVDEAIAQAPKAEGEMAGNIRLSKLNTTEDVQGFVKKVAEDNKMVIDEQRRGVVTFEEMQKLADNVGMTPEKLEKTKAGQAFTAEELIASNEVLKASAEDVVKLRDAIDAGDNSDMALLQFQQALKRHIEVQKAVSGVKAEAGRALAAQKILAREIPTEQRALKEMLDALGGRDLTEEILAKFKKIDPNDTLAVNKFIRDVGQVTKTQQVYWVWLNSILASPMTHIVNMSSNLARAVLEVPTKAAQATFELAKGKNREVFFGEIPHQVFGAVSGLKKGLERGLFVLKEGLSPEMATKLDMGGQFVKPIKGIAGDVIGLPTRALTAEDEFMKAINGTAEMNSMAYRIASREGLKGEAKAERIAELLDRPTKEMFDAVDKFAKETTFQEDLGKTGKAIMRLREQMAIGEFKPLKWIIPFVKTPTNIAKEAVRYSPLGFIDGIRKTGIERTRALAKATVGSMIVAGVALDTVEGNVTGRAPVDADERDAFYREGKQPYSIKVGDKWYSYARLEPFATIFGFTADAVKLAQEGGDPNELATKSIALVAKNFNDKTFMAGISNAINAMHDPERYGSNFVENTLAGFVPGILNYAGNIEDEFIRDPNGVKERIQARLPFAREGIVPKRNVWGERIEQAGTPLQRTISPVKSTQVKNDAVDQALKSLGMTISFPLQYLTIPKETADKAGLTKDQTKVHLDNNEYNDLIKIRGKTLKAVLDAIVSTANFKAASDKNKEAIINSIKNKVDAEVKQQYLLQILQAKKIESSTAPDKNP